MTARHHTEQFLFEFPEQPSEPLDTSGDSEASKLVLTATDYGAARDPRWAAIVAEIRAHRHPSETPPASNM